MTTTPRRPFSWVGGHTALDFVNTRAWYGDAPQSERFRSAADVLDWATEAKALPSADIDDARTVIVADTHAAAGLLAAALQTRVLLYDVLHTAAVERPWAPDLLAAFNRRLAATAAATRLEPAADSRVLIRRWSAVGGESVPVLAKLVVDTAELLTSDQVNRLRSCGNDRCGWLFLDTSRNGQRRWCDMRVCGNRLKSRRRYARVRAGED